MKIQCNVKHELVQEEMNKCRDVLDASIDSIKRLRYQIECCPLICEAILWIKSHNGTIKYAAVQELLDPGDDRVIFMISILAHVNHRYFDAYVDDFENVPKTLDKDSEYSYIRGNSQVGLMITFTEFQPC